MTLFQFEVEIEADGEGGFSYRAELVDAGPDVPYGYGSTPYVAILDLCETMTESEAE